MTAKSFLPDLLLRARSAIQRAEPLRACMHRLRLGRLGNRVYEKLRLNAGVYDATILGQRLRFSLRTPGEVRRIDSLYGEQALLARMQGALRPGDMVFDVGANIGVISLLLATYKPELGVVVHAFEPEPGNAIQLRRNIALNNLDASVCVHQFALAAETGEATFYVRGDAGCGIHSLLDGGEAVRERISVQLKTADDVVKQLGKAPDVVKIDVEGAEMDVLRGMAETLREGGVRELFLELHPERLKSRGIDAESVPAWLQTFGLESVWSHRRGAEIHQHFRRPQELAKRRQDR